MIVVKIFNSINVIFAFSQFENYFEKNDFCYYVTVRLSYTILKHVP